MMVRRRDGEEHPGWTWGPFTLRVPVYHTRIEWPELLQGLFVAGATGLALVPILTQMFQLTFEEAVACIFIHSVLISSAPIVFGEPFAAGWITPALPLVLLFLDATDSAGRAVYGSPQARIQVMTAVTLEFAALVLVLGLTGLGGRLIRWIPDALKGGIILGAAIAALERILVYSDGRTNYLYDQPTSTIVAIVLCLLLTFSVPVQRWKRRYRWLAVLSGLGLLPGFAAAALVGPLVGEVTYALQWGVLIPPFGDLFDKVAPWNIGWPSGRMWVDGFPLALVGYVILFGDLITGSEVLNSALPSRPDEKIRVDFRRSHLSLAIRNALMALWAPFFPSQGCLWTGVHVIIVQRWQEGRRAMDSLYGGITSYYVFGIPVLYLIQPIISGLKPLMGIALSLTLVLTAFACAYVAMGIPKTQIEMGVVLLTAFTLAFFPSPWIGMIVGIAATLALVGWKRPVRQE